MSRKGERYDHRQKRKWSRTDHRTGGQAGYRFRTPAGGRTEGKPRGVEYLVLDFAALDYLSSAGLRVLLAAQKVMNRQGKMVVRNINEVVAEIFEVTGFGDVLTIE